MLNDIPSAQVFPIRGVTVPSGLKTNVHVVTCYRSGTLTLPLPTVGRFACTSADLRPTRDRAGLTDWRGQYAFQPAETTAADSRGGKSGSCWRRNHGKACLKLRQGSACSLSSGEPALPWAGASDFLPASCFDHIHPLCQARLHGDH